MELNNLRYLEALYEYRSFAKAAEQIPMTTQGLHKAIRSLEDELGITIYTTSKNTLQFTSAGLYLLEFSRKTITGFDQLTLELQKLMREERNTVSVAFSTATFGVFAPAIARWIGSVQATEGVSYQTLSEAEALAGVKNGRFDFALTWGKPENGAFQYQHLASIPLYVGMNRAHPKAGRKELTIRDLAGEHLIFFSEFQKPQVVFNEMCRTEGVELDFSLNTPETMVMLTYLRSNLGISLVLPHEIELYDKTQFCAVRIAGASFPLGISSLPTHKTTREEEAFIQLLRSSVKEYTSPAL